ncbi:MAG: type II CAAX endopeptidase family protein [Bacteroidota bacterium]
MKAILQGIVLLVPILFFNQILIFNNLTSGQAIPWALPVVIIALFIYWKIVKRFDKYTGDNDIKIDFKMELNKLSSWYPILGLVFLTYAAIALIYMLVPIERTPQQQMLQLFSDAESVVAIPLLFALALHAGVVEEIVYRGFMQNTLQRKYTKTISYLIIGILFAISHFLPLELIIPYLLVSVANSYVADRRKSIGLNIFSHFVIDFVIFTGAYLGILSIGTFNWIDLAINVTLLALGLLLVFRKKNTSQELSSPIG